MRAIAMSLGENVLVSTDGGETGTQKGENKEGEQQKEEEEEMPSDEQEALKQEIIETFTDTAFTGQLSGSTSSPSSLRIVAGCACSWLKAVELSSSWSSQEDGRETPK